MTAQLLKVDYQASPPLSICLSPSHLPTNGATAKSGLHVKAGRAVETCLRAKPYAMARPLRLKRRQGCGLSVTCANACLPHFSALLASAILLMSWLLGAIPVFRRPLIVYPSWEAALILTNFARKTIIKTKTTTDETNFISSFHFTRSFDA